MPRHVSRRLGLLVVIALLVFIAAVAAFAGRLAHGAAWADVIRATIVVVCIGLLVRLIFYTTDIRTPPAPDRPKPLPPTKDEIALAYYNIVRTYESQALKLLVNIMIDRPHYLERIHEFVTVEEEVPKLQVVTRQIFRVADSARSGHEMASGLPGRDKVLLVPIVLLEKGTLLDGFGVTDGAGKDLPTLSYNQTRGLLAYVIHGIVDISPKNLKYANSLDEEIKRRVAANLVTAICSPTPMKKKDEEQQATINTLLKTIDELLASDEQKQRLKAFCETFIDHYVIVAEVPVPSGGHVVISYKQEISIDSSSLSFVNRIRSRFGLRYSTFDIPLNIFSLDVEAYHMEMDAGHRQYVFDHHLERMNSSEPLTQEDLCRGTSVPYVRLHYNSAGPTMHLYIRRQSAEQGPATVEEEDGATDATSSSPNGSTSTERLKSVVEFREIPPGTLGASVVVSLLTSTVITFFALTQIGRASAGPRQVAAGSDVPALVLALPGIASLIIGSWLDLSHLRRASLTTYLSLGVSVVLSLVSSLYFLLDANKIVPGQLSLSVIAGLMIRTDVGWLLLAGLSITSCMLVVRDLVSGSRHYFNQVKERVRRHASNGKLR